VDGPPTVIFAWHCTACQRRSGSAPRLFQTARVGTLDDVSGLRPTAHSWTGSAQDWITIPADAQAFPGNPPVPLTSLGDQRPS
jgi:hypothetical protein